MSASLLLIDPQNDFCIPGASLYVPGADEDMHRLANFINNNPELINSIHVSLDMHNYDDIAHPAYWKNSEGKNPQPFTNITIEDVENKKWIPNNLEALQYLKILKEKNSFTHTIWPYHCIAGTYGSNIFPALTTSLKKWMENTGKSFQTYIKGMDRNTEHFGIFKSEDGKSPFNNELMAQLLIGHDTILVAGQAKSHCVATSLKQILEVYPAEVEHIVLLTDTTSNVTGCDHIADEIYANLRKAGMKEMTTAEYSLKMKQNLLV